MSLKICKKLFNHFMLTAGLHTNHPNWCQDRVVTRDRSLRLSLSNCKAELESVKMFSQTCTGQNHSQQRRIKFIKKKNIRCVIVIKVL